MSKKQLKFEEALKELETLADLIERGEIGLEESIEKYEQGMKLVVQCREILNRAEQRIQKLQPESAEGAGIESAPVRDTAEDDVHR